jgi:hypothetical protein
LPKLVQKQLDQFVSQKRPGQPKRFIDMWRDRPSHSVIALFRKL